MFFDEEIKPETLLQVLFNVRKIEHYENQEAINNRVNKLIDNFYSCSILIF